MESCDSTIRENSLWLRDERAVWRVIDGSTVCLTLDGEYMVHEFNDTATHVWNLLEQPRTIPQMAWDMSEEFDAPPAQIEQDLRTFLPLLLDIGLVRVDGSESQPSSDGPS